MLEILEIGCHMLPHLVAKVKSIPPEQELQQEMMSPSKFYHFFLSKIEPTIVEYLFRSLNRGPRLSVVYRP